MGTPFDGTTIDETNIDVTWSALASPANGGSTITSYHLQYDDGTSGVTWTDLVGLSPSSTATTYTLTGITAGTTYQFKVRASNIFGWGDYSSTHSILAAVAPSQMVAVTTSIDATTGGVMISWTAPHDGSDSITSYKIEIADTAGTTWTEDLTDCDGSDGTILTNMYCIIPMSTLTAGPYSYAFDELVEVRASATNSIGTGTVSTTNTAGAQIRQVPD